MLTALLLNGYSRGISSSRQLARACEERVDVMAVTGLNRADFRIISDVRRRHRAALSALFVMVLRLCQAAGPVRLGHVVVDSTKLSANASEHKAMSYRPMASQEPKLAAEMQARLDRAAAADAAEDAEHGEARGDETPPDRAQRNVTAPASRIMPNGGGGFIAGQTSQIAVAAAHQLIVARHLTTNPADDAALVPLVDRARFHLGRKPREVSGDRGFAKVRGERPMLCAAHTMLKLRKAAT
jgi:hypothetical protein